MGTKLTGKPATTSILGTDIVPVVTDPAGTPLSKRITGENLANSLAAIASLADEAFVASAIDDAVEELQEDLAGGVMYQGTWNATTNSPTIPAAATENKGHYYKVTTAGTTAIDGISDWQVGDVIVSNGASWDKWDHTTPTASESQAGLVELANAAEMIAGTATDRAVTPALLMNALQIKTINVTEKDGTVTLDPGDDANRIPDLDTMILNVVTLPAATSVGDLSIMLPPAVAGKILMISRSNGDGGDLYIIPYTGENFYFPWSPAAMLDWIKSKGFLVLIGITWKGSGATEIGWGGIQFGHTEFETGRHPLSFPYASQE